MIVARLNDLLGESLTSILDLPARYDELATLAKARLTEDFSKYGVDLSDFYINSVTPPDEVLARLDERASMGAVGDLSAYTRFKAAVALGDAARADGGAGGTAAAGMGVGLGAGFGVQMAGALSEAMKGGAAGGGAAAADHHLCAVRQPFARRLPLLPHLRGADGREPVPSLPTTGAPGGQVLPGLWGAAGARYEPDGGLTRRNPSFTGSKVCGFERCEPVGGRNKGKREREGTDGMRRLHFRCLFPLFLLPFDPVRQNHEPGG